MRATVVLAGLLLSAMAVADLGGLTVQDLPPASYRGDPIVREDFERCEPAGAVLRDERRPDAWLLRTQDWPSRLLNAMGNPPDLTYDPQLSGVYDIYLGSRATHFPVAVGLRLAGEPDYTIITSPCELPDLHRDWEFCFRRAVRLEGEKLVLHALGAAAYVDYLKFVPVVEGTARARVAQDHVVIASEPGKHFAFPGVARLTDGSLAVVCREGTAHVDPSGSVALCLSTGGGQTWTPRRTIYDNPRVDERDPGIWQHSDGTLLVSLASDGSRVMRSTDSGQTWDEPAPAPVFSPHGPAELPDGRLYWCGISTEMGMNVVRIATSADLGRTWDAGTVAGLSLSYHQPWVGPFWDEPWAMPLRDGRWLAMHRVDLDGYLYSSTSTDGRAFTTPQRTAMWGCPPSVLRLQDGRLVCLYGYRREPFGIRACVSTDAGQTWDTANEIVLRHDGGHGDLGYPTALEVSPGLVLAVYYHNRGGPECTIEGTYFRP
jgi:hypothetical protein